MWFPHTLRSWNCVLQIRLKLGKYKVEELRKFDAMCGKVLLTLAIFSVHELLQGCLANNEKDTEAKDMGLK